MGIRMRKSIKIAPGVRLNLGKSSVGMSFGTKGLRYSLNSSGRKTASVGIPGTGISYVKSMGGPTARNHRESYVEYKRLQAQIAKEEAMQQAHNIALEYETKIRALKTIHTECDERVNWKEIKLIPEPFVIGTVGPHEKIALESLNGYKPTMIEKMLKGLQQKKINELERNVLEARKRDEEDYRNWQNIQTVSTKVLDGDIDALLVVIEEMAPLDDLVDFGSGFEFIVESPETVEIEFDVMSEQVIPKEIKTLTQTGKLSVKQMPKAAYYDLLQDYVCSCVIRIARDMFAILPFEKAVIHVNDNFINPATGLEESCVILSVEIDRETLDKLNMALIDPSDAMSNFRHNMKFLKTQGFKPVEKIQT